MIDDNQWADRDNLDSNAGVENKYLIYAYIVETCVALHPFRLISRVEHVSGTLGIVSLFIL